jgi:hypothetical protein
VLTEALAAGGDEAKRAFDAMLGMKKIDIAAIKAARRGATVPAQTRSRCIAPKSANDPSGRKHSYHRCPLLFYRHKGTALFFAHRTALRLEHTIYCLN